MLSNQNINSVSSLLSSIKIHPLIHPIKVISPKRDFLGGVKNARAVSKSNMVRRSICYRLNCSFEKRWAMSSLPKNLMAECRPSVQ